MIYLIDASVYVFRAYYSVPDDMVDANGAQTNAVYGFARFLLDLLQTSNASHAAVAFDESLTTSFRNEIYPQYKANREPAPEELKRQFAWCKRVAQGLGLRTVAHERFEADDLIGTLAHAARAQAVNTVIVTRDKDLAQLITPGDEFFDFAGGRRITHDQINEVFGTAPERIADYLALTGDSVDNIPGVPGIGKKTAGAIFDRYASLDEVYAHLDDLHELPIRGARTLSKKLSEHRDAAYLAQRLTRIHLEAPVDTDIAASERRPIDHAALATLFDELDFGAFLRTRVAKLSDA
ncbi:MAG: 5'-3' exonuclease H3TH domain-containing protein [Gammaproteobacteria bacterium]